MKVTQKIIEKVTLTLEEQAFLAELFMLADKYNNNELLFECVEVSCSDCPLFNRGKGCSRNLLTDIISTIECFKEVYSNKED